MYCWGNALVWSYRHLRLFYHSPIFRVFQGVNGLPWAFLRFALTLCCVQETAPAVLPFPEQALLSVKATHLIGTQVATSREHAFPSRFLGFSQVLYNSDRFHVFPPFLWVFWSCFTFLHLSHCYIVNFYDLDVPLWYFWGFGLPSLKLPALTTVWGVRFTT